MVDETPDISSSAAIGNDVQMTLKGDSSDSYNRTAVAIRFHILGYSHSEKWQSDFFDTL